METLKSKPNSPAPDFNLNDCNKVIDIHKKAQHEEISEALNIERMLYRLNLSFGIYRREHLQDTAPTIKQLKEQHTDIRRKSQNLLISLQENTDIYFLSSLACSIAEARSPINIEDDEYEHLMSEIYEELGNLGTSLKWLIDKLDPCTTEQFDYIHTKRNPKIRSPAENRFVKNLATVMNEHLGTGGYYSDSHKNTYSGWKIDCIEYLLNCVGVERNRGQIFAVLNSSNSKKKT